MAEKRSTGKVRWFNDSKGFGFIVPDEGGENLFVHFSSMRSDGFRSLAEGDSVEYQIFVGTKGGPMAIDVTGLNGAPLKANVRTTSPAPALAAPVGSEEKAATAIGKTEEAAAGGIPCYCCDQLAVNNLSSGV